MKEQWRPVRRFPNYEVSNKGRVRAVEGSVRGLGSVGPSGTPVVSLWDPAARRNRSVTVARLVWEAFQGPLRSDERVRRIRTDRRVSPQNLEKRRNRRA